MSQETCHQATGFSPVERGGRSRPHPVGLNPAFFEAGFLIRVLLSLLLLLPTVVYGRGDVVSLSPSVTEFVYELGAGHRLAAVTRYCLFPESAKKLAKVGGYFDTNLEAIVRLQPSLVIARRDNPDIIENLKKRGIPVLDVEHRHLKGIVASAASIGAALDRTATAAALVARMEAGLREPATAVKHRPRVLLAAGREASSGLGKIYAAASDGFYSELIRLAGGVNVLENKNGFVALGREGVLALEPDLVIDILPGVSGEEVGRVQRDWETLPGLGEALKKNVHVISEDYAVVPGPRILKLLEDIRACVRRQGGH